MLTVTASGTLIANPVKRINGACVSYVQADMRAPLDNSEAVFITLTCFSDNAMAAIAGLAKGAHLTITAKGKVSSWTKNNTQQYGLSVTVAEVTRGGT